MDSQMALLVLLDECKELVYDNSHQQIEHIIKNQHPNIYTYLIVRDSQYEDTKQFLENVNYYNNNKVYIV